MKVFIIFLLIGSSVATRLISSDELKHLFINYAKNVTTESELRTLQDVFEIYRPASTALKQQYESNSRTSIVCLLCRSLLGAFFDLVKSGHSDEDLTYAGINLCTSLSIVSPRTCRGVVPLNIPILTYIVRNTPDAAPRTFCSILLQTADNPNICVYTDTRFEWTVNLPEKVNVQKKAKVNTINPELTVALLTDGHIDPLYEPNGVADCTEPTCCRKGQTPRNFDYDEIGDVIFEDGVIEENNEYNLNLDIANNIRNEIRMESGSQRNSAPAGYWGDYRNCDTPEWAYDDVIERVTTHEDIDVVYYIGDNIDHHVWETTYELIDNVNFYIIDKMRKEFGDNVLIIPSIGNHESQPTNQFAPSSVTGEKLNTTWLYDSLAKKWDHYLIEEAKETIREHGGFSILIRPGLRVISINSNIAYKFNWWLVHDPLAGKRHLDWLVEELYKAELAGEKVHILSHIPPGIPDLIFTWTREYNRIVTRFSSTIAGEFNGHIHSDEFKIFYSLEDGSPINMAWGAGSATAYTFYNLNYKIATFNTTTYEPLNIVNYVYNLTEANLMPNIRPRWFQLYNMRNSFNINDLSASTMNNLVYKMVTDDLLSLELYAAFYSKLSDSRWPTCNNNCKIDNLCKTVVTVLWEREKCEELRRLFFS